jgi:predicted Zn-dependent protease
MYDKVRELYEIENKVFNNEKEITIKIAETYEKEGNSYSYRKVYKDFLIKKEDSEIRMNIVYSYLKDNFLDSAKTQLFKILEYEPNNFESNKILFEIYMESKQIDSMFITSNNFYKHYNEEFIPNYYLAKSYFYKGIYDSSIKYSESSISLNSKNPFPYEILADIYLIYHNDSSAKKMIQHSVKNSLITIEKLQEELNLIVNNLGPNSSQKNKRHGDILKNEVEAIRKLISKNFTNLSHLLSEIELFTYLNLLLKNFPRNPLLLIQAANLYYEYKKIDSSEIYYKQALILNSSIKEGHLGLALIHTSKENYNEAIKSYRRLLAIDSESQEWYDKLIQLSLLNGTAIELGNDWIKIYNTNKKNKLLKERLIELLHKTNRFEEANKLVKEH